MRYKFLRFPEGKVKALTLSYDDGCKFDPELIRIADKYGIKVTLNINSNLIGSGDWHISAETLKGFQKNGHEIAVHGKQHIALGKADYAAGIAEVLFCKKELEEVFGGIIRGMAYADSGITDMHNGVKREEIFDYLEKLGIAYSRTLGNDNNSFKIPENFYAWVPTAHHNNPKLFEYLDEFLNFDISNYYFASRAPKLFYLWGHSYEFDHNNNWEILERFCETASGKDDIWYATNIEICDYVNAYLQLKFNVDNTLVYNPTAKTIWFDADGKTVCVKPGETKEF